MCHSKWCTAPLILRGDTHRPELHEVAPWTGLVLCQVSSGSSNPWRGHTTLGAIQSCSLEQLPTVSSSIRLLQYLEEEEEDAGNSMKPFLVAVGEGASTSPYSVAPKTICPLVPPKSVTAPCLIPQRKVHIRGCRVRHLGPRCILGAHNMQSVFIADYVFWGFGRERKGDSWALLEGLYSH